MAMGPCRNHIGLHTEVEGKEGRRWHIAAAPHLLFIRGMSLINEGLTTSLGSIRIPREGVPAGGVGDHSVGMNDLSTGQLHPNGLAPLDQDLVDLRFVPDGTTMAFQPLHKFLGNNADAALGVIDASGMAV